ncbi:hypothetical protein FisN_13Lh308 [Fistulifera solaris]|uniref:Uncharacterized protein n=1 Tax=Fistulifera solaris TaxID=1519565 RepID=A0A1Z5KM46_FISSO|nr:hypothetical protein FisN_13Lh308 [Fistulifera solaris]|eukprot:GAX27142.1 hypothetical protein FisN_13Lh308 [Fistulifera solaris]
MKTLIPSSPSSLTTLSDTEHDMPMAPEILPAMERKKMPRQNKTFLLVTVILAVLIFLIALVSTFMTRSKVSQESVSTPIREPSPTAAPIMSTLAPVVPKTPPTASPTLASSLSPTVRSPTTAPTRIAFDPGNLVKDSHGLLLSVGLQARILAQAGRPVRYNAAQTSSLPFHAMPDFGATFPDTRPENPGGWIYVSNSEVRRPWYQGGVGAITFDSRGETIDYRMLLTNTTANCGGGVTPRPPEILTVGNEKGMYESFAADLPRNQYFVTEDFETGPVRRFIPLSTHPTDPWKTLHGEGETTYLFLQPTSEQEGTYEWISNKNRAQSNAQALFPNCEGIDVHGDKLYFISKKIETVFVLDLAGNSYRSYSTRQGLFQGQPDQMIQLHGNADNTLYFFTEDGSASAGVHARNRAGQILTILEGPNYSNEVTGLAFSPDNTRMYIAFQDDGILFEIVRQDGLPFTARSLNLRYHSSGLDAM